MKALFTCTLLLLGVVGYTQEPFINYYSTFGSARSTVDTLSNGNIWGSFGRSSGTGVLDRSGMELHTQSYASDTFLFLQSARKISDNEFAFCGIYTKDTCDTVDAVAFKPAIGRMDSSGTILNANYIRFTDNCAGGIAGDLIVTEDNSSITWGRDHMFFAVRMNENGTVRWARQFSNGGGIRFIRELPGGDLIAGMNMDSAGAVITRMNADGQVLWAKSYFRPRGMMADCLVGSDDSFTVVAFTDSSATTAGFLEPSDPNYQPKLTLLHLNGAGEVQWCKAYDSAPNYWYTRDGARIKRAPDGNAFVYSDIGLPGYNSPYHAFLMKTDLNGDTLWTRAYGISDDLYNIRDMLPCLDGSVLCTGFGLVNGFFLFRTDPLGYLPCQDRSHQLVVTELFPTDSAITLTSVDGAQAFPAYLTPIETEALVVSNACGDPLEVPNDALRPRIRIRPNPTPGRITLSFPDPLERDSYYSVIDATGRLLYQRPLPAGGTEEDIDLSRFGPGTYVLRITDPEGQRNERVVVE